jgi:hypothetical protein
MRSYPLGASPFWVEVVITEGDGHIETGKYHGEKRYVRHPVPISGRPCHKALAGLAMKNWLTSGLEIIRADSSFSFLRASLGGWLPNIS